MKYIILLLFFFLFATPAFAKSGCCSHHGGVSYCGDNGYYICNDGEESPSCTCGYVPPPREDPPYVPPTDPPVYIPDEKQTTDTTTYNEPIITPVPTKTLMQFVTDASPAGSLFYSSMGFLLGTIFGSLGKK